MRGVHARARVHRPLRVRRMVQYEGGGHVLLVRHGTDATTHTHTQT